MKTVKLAVMDGVVSAIEIPADTRVIVCDYDVDGLDLSADDIKKDACGFHYIETILELEDVPACS